MKNLNNKIVFSWDTYNWSRALRIWTTNSTIDKGGLNCLEIGAGPGGVSLWLALNRNKVLSTEFLDDLSRAKKLHVDYNVEESISYSKLDVKNIPFENEFDIIILKSVLGGIGTNDDVNIAIKQIHKALKPGGYFVFAETLQGSPLLMWLRRRFSGCGHYWNYLDFDFFIKELQIFKEVEYSRFGMFGVLGRNETQKAIIGFIDKHFFEKSLPKKYSYIVAGVAKK